MKNYYEIYYSNSKKSSNYSNSNSNDFNSLSNFMKGLLSMKKALKRREEKRDWIFRRIQYIQLLLLREENDYEFKKMERYLNEVLMMELSSIEREIRNYKIKIEMYQER